MSTDMHEWIICVSMHVLSIHFPAFSQTSGEFKEEYKSLLNSPEYEKYDSLSVAGVAYDAVWAMAIGLDTASERVRTGNDSGCDHLPGDLVPLEEFDYSNAKMGCVLEESFSEISFMGITVSAWTSSNLLACGSNVSWSTKHTHCVCICNTVIMSSINDLYNSHHN